MSLRTIPRKKTLVSSSLPAGRQVNFFDLQGEEICIQNERENCYLKHKISIFGEYDP